MNKVGRYNIVSELGRGAMGIVYKAFDPIIGREVALKVLTLSDAGPEGTNSPQEMFVREVRAAGRLAHPSIVTIHDAFDDPEAKTGCIVMEMVPGRTLEKILESSQPLTIQQSLELIRQVAEALDYAHRNKVIHRDLKPANILVTEEGRAKITDFGIAKVLAREGLARTVGMMGTPSYMSPEQVTGSEVDGRTDIFSLGIIMFTMLAGKKPFTGNTAAVMFRIVYEEPPKPSSFNPQLTAAYDYVVGRCLAKDRNARYASARELLDDVTDLQHGQAPRSWAGHFAPPPPAPPIERTLAMPIPHLPNAAPPRPAVPLGPPAPPAPTLRPPAAPPAPWAPPAEVAAHIPRLGTPLKVRPEPPAARETLVMPFASLREGVSLPPSNAPAAPPAAPASPYRSTVPLGQPAPQPQAAPPWAPPLPPPPAPGNEHTYSEATQPMEPLRPAAPTPPPLRAASPVPPAPPAFPERGETIVAAGSSYLPAAGQPPFEIGETIVAEGPSAAPPAHPTDAFAPAAATVTTAPAPPVPAPARAGKSKLLPILFGVVFTVLIVEGVWAYWKYHKRNAAPAPEVAVQTLPSTPPAVTGQTPETTPATPPPAVAEAPAPPVGTPPVAAKKTTRKTKQASAKQPEPAPAAPVQPEPVAPAPQPVAPEPSPEAIAKAEAAKLAKVSRVVQVNCDSEFKEATITFLAGGQPLFQQTLKGKRKKEGFLGIKGSYEGSFSRTVTIPAGVQEVSVHVVSREKSTNMSKVTKLPPPGGFVPTLNVEADVDNLSLAWKNGN
jgi:serine/threonine protein kinase